MQKKFTMHSGLPEFDKVVNRIISGDNIVFQVNSIDDYIPFVHPFCYQAKKEKRKLIYFRFAQHIHLIPEDIEADIYNLDPEKGFEAFISEIFNIIEKHGYGACYVFDCLSELTADWYSDRMLGNFFMLTCPYLYDFETATYFAIFKNMHIDLALNAIHNTAQIVLDVYRNQKSIFIQPLKVIGRFSNTMFMLHEWKNNEFIPVTNSATISEILAKIPQPWLNFSIQRVDLWTRVFSTAYKFLNEKESCPVEEENINLLKKLIRMIISRDEKFSSLAEKYFDLEKIIDIAKRLIGTGLIGGKSAGMLLARAILEKNNPKWKNILEAHDSFFIGSDVYYTYIIHNKCWWPRRELLKHKQFSEENINQVRTKMLNGTFTEDVKRQFMEMIDYFGQSPIIVRSSSLLEDAYGNAFSGKYESVFCANQGTPEDRLYKFMEAVKIVYASTLRSEALSYREHFCLLDREEQMALLVQRVSGSKYNDYYYPQVSGVGFSFNPYVWSKEIDPKSGLIRMVFGLGTRAVDRSDDDYTRIIALNSPTKRPEYTLDEVNKYSQKKMDLLDLKANSLTTKQFEEVVKNDENVPLEKFASVDNDIEERAKQYNLHDVFPYVLTFENLLTNSNFTNDMKDILLILKEAYNHHVDIEFTLNFFNSENYKINLLQCRPFQTKGDLSHVELPKNIDTSNIIIKTKGPVIGSSISTLINRIIYVNSNTYSNLSINDRYLTARIVGKITTREKSTKKNIALIGPGRWGTTSPSLGVPVTFKEISSVSVICEIAEMHEGLVPDVSLGTHFFNDLVEMDILYLAIYPDRKDYIINRDFFLNSKNKLTEILPDEKKWEDIIKVIDTDINLNVNVITQDGIFYKI
ncbi:MAG: pyruvate, phosphate dikinase [Spirochaetes bacterium]|nr:pyruvate, phosphate dikinase [Spirochaetota bacterium]